MEKAQLRQCKGWRFGNGNQARRDLSKSLSNLIHSAASVLSLLDLAPLPSAASREERRDSLLLLPISNSKTSCRPYHYKRRLLEQDSKNSVAEEALATAETNSTLLKSVTPIQKREHEERSQTRNLEQRPAFSSYVDASSPSSSSKQHTSPSVPSKGAGFAAIDSRRLNRNDPSVFCTRQTAADHYRAHYRLGDAEEGSEGGLDAHRFYFTLPDQRRSGRDYRRNFQFNNSNSHNQYHNHHCHNRAQVTAAAIAPTKEHDILRRARGGDDCCTCDDPVASGVDAPVFTSAKTLSASGKKETKDLVSTSAVDVRQLVNSPTSAHGYHQQQHKGLLAGTKSSAITCTGSVSEIRCCPSASLGGSTEKLSDASSPSAERDRPHHRHHHNHQQQQHSASASSLLPLGVELHPTAEASNQQQRCSSASSSTKHGSLLRDRINKRLNRTGGGDESKGGLRSTSIRMKQTKKERLDAWATDFDRLLRDAAGLYAFSEFLRTQYCQENINFWVACENFKLVADNTRAEFAMDLYRNYFASGCTEPVNVDSLARQAIQDAIDSEKFTQHMFNAAQYQIFHLMKYDCYPRFLKSDEYKNCAEMCEKGQQMPEMKEPFLKNVDISASSALSLTAKSSTTGDDQHKKSRKSILAWKNKFVGGVNIIRHKSKKEDDTHSGTVMQHQPSTSSSVGINAAGTEAPHDSTDLGASLSSLGSKRKQAWRHSKQLSTPAEAAHAVRKASGSVEGLHHHPLHSRPNSGLATSKPPDVVPQPDPPSSPSPGTRPRNVHSPKAKAPGSPLLGASAPATSFGDARFSCTLILPSGERIQAPVSEDLTVRRWLHELALRHGFNTATTDVYDVQTDVPVDLATNAGRALAGKTVRLEGGVLFKVDLPCASTSAGGGQTPDAGQRKLIAVKARADGTAGQVLRPILLKYGLQLDSMVICVAGSNEVLPNHSPIMKANNKKLMVLSQSEFEEWVHRDHESITLLSSRSSPSRSSLSPSFEDIIGAKYFQELPAHKGLGIAELPPEPENLKHGRHGHASQPQHAGMANGHKQGGGGMLKFVKRGAAETKITTHHHQQLSTKSTRLSTHPPPASHQQTSTSSHGGNAVKKACLTKEELLELAREEKQLGALLSRAQASSFDDQRGASVKNFELPDFLKQPVVSANAQTSSMDDSLIPSQVSTCPTQHEAFQSRPTELVHRKLCGVPVGQRSCEDDLGDINVGLSTASGSCEDEFAFELLNEQHDDDKDHPEESLNFSNRDFLKSTARESKLPTHEEAEKLFNMSGGLEPDFGDPTMTERRRLSEFGLGKNVKNPQEFIDQTVRSASIDDRTSMDTKTTIRAPPPSYEKLAAHCSRNTPEKISPADAEKKRKGVYLQNDEEWQVDYV